MSLSESGNDQPGMLSKGLKHLRFAVMLILSRNLQQ